MNAVDTCSWDQPGADRFTGSVPAAIAAYGLPIATQQALVSAFERREFTDAVVIDRDTIRGQAHEYEPGIRSMHFGSRGRVCGQVTRSGWRAYHVETALVVCAADECIAWPAVCGNVFRLARRAERDPAGERSLVPGGVPAVAGLPEALFALPSEPTGAGVLTAPPAAEQYGGGWYPLAGAGFAAGGIDYGPCCLTATLGGTVAAVPEPATWLSLLGGLVLIAAAWRRA